MSKGFRGYYMRMVMTVARMDVRLSMELHAQALTDLVATPEVLGST